MTHKRFSTQGNPLTYASEIIYDIRDWHIPTQKYPLKKKGNAELIRVTQAPGFYPMEGVFGYQFYRVHAPIKVTVLKIDGKEWMVDDPLHWLGIGYWLNKFHGKRLLCAGLGLGLHVWHALAAFESITVIEINQNVIDLVKPNLPADKKISIINDDFYNTGIDDLDQFDCVLWDLASTDAHTDVSSQYRQGMEYCSKVFPKAELGFFGTMRRNHNPIFEAGFDFSKTVMAVK